MNKISINRSDVILVGTVLVIVAGLAEALTGWSQLLGISRSLHAGYPVTGTFYNPGPMCGFLATVMPVALASAIGARCRWLSWTGMLCLVMSVTLMPVLMGRTGWVAAAAGCLCVLAGSRRLPRVNGPVLWIVVMAVLIVTAMLLYCMKPQSAMGRLLLWRDGVGAMASNPMTGVGWDCVAGALGTAQEEYFAANAGSPFTAVAGSPHYAFNEFLQIGTAYGIVALVAYAGLLGWALTCAVRGRRYGLAGSVLAFIIVCMASYPLQFPEFIGTMAVVVIISIGCCKKTGAVMWSVIAMPVAVLALAACTTLYEREEKRAKWDRARPAYIYRLTDTGRRQLDSLMAGQMWNCRFLFDYGKILRENGALERSNEVLATGLERSADPMFLNLLGRNCHDQGRYADAELYLQRSINRLPGRLYPYYLLGKLYADPDNFQPDKFRLIYIRAMQLEIKIQSPAINQMKLELGRLNDSISAITRAPDLCGAGLSRGGGATPYGQASTATTFPWARRYC